MKQSTEVRCAGCGSTAVTHVLTKADEVSLWRCADCDLVFAGEWADLVADNDYRYYAVRLDWPVFAYAAAALVLVGAGFGLLPAWRAARTDLRGAMNHSGRSATLDYLKRLRTFDPLAPARTVLDAAKTAADQILEEARPTGVFAPVTEVPKELVTA